MNTKKILIVILFTCIAAFAKAQYLTIGGITVQASSTLYVENGEAKSDPCDQLYNISFKDLVLSHSIYVGGIISVSQLYQLSGVNRYMDGDITVIKFTGLSGRSGLTYKYDIKVDADGNLISLVCTEESGNKTTYKGKIIEFRSFKQ